MPKRAAREQRPVSTTEAVEEEGSEEDLLELDALEIDSGESDAESEGESLPGSEFLFAEELSVEMTDPESDADSIDLEEIRRIGEAKLKEQEKDPLNIRHDPGSDSSEDERTNRNTIGEVPLKWYRHEDHIGYDLEGRKIAKSEKKDRLDRLLEKMDKDGLVTSFYDAYNDEEVQISRADLRTLLNIKKGKFPDAEMEPYMEYPNWFTSKPRIHPLSNALKPKSSFVPSQYEERRVAQLVRAIRAGKLKKADRLFRDPDAPRMIWAEDGRYEREGSRLAYLQPPKKAFPGHEESFNPPKEYLPTKKERKSMEERNELYKEDTYPKFIPEAFDSLRKVPGYERYAREVFERCLDLFMCPRMKPRRKKEVTDKKELIPDLPKAKDLQPFPTTLYLKFSGHQGKVRSLDVECSGQWLASGSDDGTAKVWEVLSGRCVFTYSGSTPVSCVAWHPKMKVLSVVAGRHLLLIPVPLPQPQPAAAKSILRLSTAETREDAASLVQWTQRADGGIDIEHPFLLKSVSWHRQGDYFATVQPNGGTKVRLTAPPSCVHLVMQSVLVHRLSHKATQNPFKKSHGKMVQVSFHPTQPHFMVLAEDRLRIYNLIKQQLVKKLSVKRKGAMTCLDIHPGGENLLVGGEDNQLAWYDLELSARPYKALRFHKHAIHSVRFHQSYPLFASASDDCTVQVFHGMVYDDLSMNALIVPLKILKGHAITDFSGVLDCIFHPKQPWLFTAGGDGNVHLYTN